MALVITGIAYHHFSCSACTVISRKTEGERLPEGDTVIADAVIVIVEKPGMLARWIGRHLDAYDAADKNKSKQTKGKYDLVFFDHLCGLRLYRVRIPREGPFCDR